MTAQNGRVWFITGSTSGFGRAFVDAARARGERVVATARRPEALAELEGDDVLVLPLDVTRDDAIEPALDAAVERFGRIDVLVNNAATFEMNPFDGDDYARWQSGWRRTFDLNVFGAANAAFLAMRSMRKNGGGKIINVASRAAFRGETEFADYGASKAALVNLTRSVARPCPRVSEDARLVWPRIPASDRGPAALLRRGTSCRDEERDRHTDRDHGQHRRRPAHSGLRDHDPDRTRAGDAADRRRGKKPRRRPRIARAQLCQPNNAGRKDGGERETRHKVGPRRQNAGGSGEQPDRGHARTGEHDRALRDRTWNKRDEQAAYDQGQPEA